MVGYLFAGQGAQYVGMGRDLYDAFAESRLIFERADKTLGFDLSGMCFEGPADELTLTHNCQPAILTVSIAAWEAFKSAHGSELKAQSYAAGLSLGEYSALVAAEALSFEDAVSLVRQRGQFMEDASKGRPGKMVSVIGLELTSLKEICRETGVEIANLNCPGQVVISGGTADIDKAAQLCQQKGAKRVIELEVSGAFHSSFMQEASLKLAQALEKVSIKIPKMPLVSNVNAHPANSAQEIKGNLIKQVSSSVLWEDSMRFMLSKGVTHFFEFGPGKVLKGLMRSIDADAEVINIEKKEDIILRG